MAMKIVEFLIRTATTVVLLVLVYQGSRVALVIVLALICLGLELVALMLRWARDSDQALLDALKRATKVQPRL